MTRVDIAEACWWLREALGHPEFRGEPAPALDRDIDADVAIVGGGYTGLWTAWHLVSTQPGIRVVVLERDQCGFGPSGRNGGFINGFYDHAGTLLELFGREGALAMLDAGSRTLEELERWMTEHGVDAWFRREGYMGVASSPAQVGGWEEPIAVAREDVPTAVLDKEREIYRAQMADQKKPAAVLDKIVEGKLEKFFSEQCLLEQPFIKDVSGKTRVKDRVDAVNAKTQERIVVRRFARFAVGEGG